MNLLTPSWINIARTETTAFAAFRCNDPAVTGWNRLVSQAQYILSQLPNASDATLLDDRNKQAYEIITASTRILDLAAQANSATDRETHFSLILSSIVAFGAAGNFAAAMSVIDRNREYLGIPTAHIAAVLATNSPYHLGDMVRHTASNRPVRRYLEAFGRFLGSGNNEAMADAETHFLALFNETDDVFTLNLLYLSKAALRQVNELSFARAMISARYEIKNTHLRSILASDFKTLLPPQCRALLNGFLDFKGNKIISQPTSTGKSFLAELAIASSFQNLGDIGVIITPYVALGRQIAKALRKHLPASCDVHHLYGGYRVPSDRFDNESYHVVVATPERLDAWMRFNPDFLERVRCVVADEMHLIESGARGIRLESLLTRFRLLQKRGYDLQIVLMSAVSPSDDGVQAWMGGEDLVRSYQDTWKPTARRVAIWRSTGELVWFAGSDQLLPPGFAPHTEAGKVRLAWVHKNFYPSSNIGVNRKLAPLAMENVAYLVEHLWNQFQEPILCICGTKYTTRLLAYSVAQRFQSSPSDPPPGPRTGEAIQLISGKYPYLAVLAECLLKGIAYHNGSLPHDLRELIELAVLEQELKCVAATTTLAEGVDLPFRATILVDWLFPGGGKSPIPISSKLFKNIAGRCGRAGKHTEGDVILFDNPIGEEQFTAGHTRPAWQRRILFDERVEPLTSALQFESVNPAIGASLESQFLAAIQENPNVEDIASEFAASLLYGRNAETDNNALHLLQSAESYLLQGFAERNSPLRLTEFGAASNQTGFCPRSCIKICDALSNLGQFSSKDELIADLLVRLIGLPEQSVHKFTESLGKPRSKYCVKIAEIPQILQKWREDVPLQIIFAEMPHWTKSKSKVALSDWLTGKSPFSSWDEQFDNFTAFCSEVIGNFLPWLLRACEMLKRFGDANAQQINWNALADDLDKIADE